MAALPAGDAFWLGIFDSRFFGKFVIIFSLAVQKLTIQNSLFTINLA
jgi:hypothetical protein